jgi:MFS family permease
MSDSDKATATTVEKIEAQVTDKDEPLAENFFPDDEFVDYQMTWRTGAAVLSLALLFGVTTFAITGPNFAISNMVETFPAGAKNAIWIADAGLIAAVSLPNIVGTTSDRYGKKWFLVTGPIIAAVGAIVAGSSKNLNTIIGGQAIGGLGSSMGIASVPAGMEVVPAKYRPLVFALMAVFNGLLGAVGGPFTCELINSPPVPPLQLNLAGF